MVGISVDPVGRNAAMVDKLRLPFPLLSDPGGAGAIKRYDVWHPEPKVARPATVVVGPDGVVASRRVGTDYADRPTEQEVLDEVMRLRLPATTQPAPRPGTPEPSERAVDPSGLPNYLRGAKFAATAMGMRQPDVKVEADALVAEYDRYLAVVKEHLAGR